MVSMKGHLNTNRVCFNEESTLRTLRFGAYFSSNDLNDLTFLAGLAEESLAGPSSKIADSFSAAFDSKLVGVSHAGSSYFRKAAPLHFLSLI